MAGGTAMNVKIGETEIEKKILFEIREDWLALHREAPIDPAMPIIDPHHHLWDRGARYLLEDIKGDIDAGGHNVRATVFSQCDSMYRADGDPKFAPIGETEFVNGVSAMSASNTYGPARVCAGIVGFADLLLGAAEVDAVLEAHLRAAGDRFKGVRHCSVWDADRSIKSTPFDYPPQLLLDGKFRSGFARLGRYGLSFDSLIYHTQIPELTDLAKTFADTLIVLDHIGIPLGIGAYAGRHDEVFKAWTNNIRELAKCPNTRVKLGGMGMHLFGFGFEKQPKPPTSEELAEAWRPYVEICIEAFGPRRAMFESNFPVDKRYYSYGVMWNAYKRLAAGYSADETAGLFFCAAKETYRLPV
jgi:predicted TIM-barrel fold metal-dependent hydrolase